MSKIIKFISLSSLAFVLLLSCSSEEAQGQSIQEGSPVSPQESSLSDFGGSELQELLIKNLFDPPAEPLLPPDIVLQDLRGEQQTLSGQKGKITALNFWATWCGPCREEMPSMQALHDLYNNRGFQVVAVNIQEDKETVEPFIKEYGISFPIWMDLDGAVTGLYGVHSIPTTYLVNGEGLVVGRLIGSIDWMAPNIQEVIQKLIETLEA